MRASLLILFCLLLSSCSAPQDPPTVLTPTVETPSVEISTVDLKEHSVIFTKSNDGGETWIQSETLAEAASVPNLMLLHSDVGDFNAGTLFMHFVDASEMNQPGEERIAFISSADDGSTWDEERTIININNVPKGAIPVDPSLVQLEDGRMRIYFFDFSASKQPHQTSTFQFMAATSDDGINFDYDGIVYEFCGELITDPGSDQDLIVTTSEDGLSFTEVNRVLGWNGIPGLLDYDGTVVLFGCDQQVSWLESIDGITYDLDDIKSLTIGGCDPDPVLFSDGSIGLSLKTFKHDEQVSEPSAPFPSGNSASL